MITSAQVAASDNPITLNPSAEALSALLDPSLRPIASSFAPESFKFNA